MNALKIDGLILQAVDRSTTLSDFRKGQIKRIMTSRFRPVAKRNITDNVTAALLAEEAIVVSEQGVEAAFDIDKILSIIERLLPMIERLIALFG